MTKHFCDRCDQQTDLLIHVSLSHANGGSSTKVELCHRCLAYLHDAVQPLPKAAPAVERAVARG